MIQNSSSVSEWGEWVIVLCLASWLASPGGYRQWATPHKNIIRQSGWRLLLMTETSHTTRQQYDWISWTGSPQRLLCYQLHHGNAIMSQNMKTKQNEQSGCLWLDQQPENNTHCLTEMIQSKGKGHRQMSGNSRPGSPRLLHPIIT